jgi:hypothetical protein
MELHRIFVKYGEQKSNGLSLKLLRFVRKNLSVFKEIGIKFQVTEFSARDLEKNAARQTLRGLSISQLPALVTPRQTYHGTDTIIGAYVENIDKYYADADAQKKKAAPKKAAFESEEQLVDQYLTRAIGNANDDWNEDPLAEDIERTVSGRFAEEREKRMQLSSGPSKNRDRHLLDDAGGDPEEHATFAVSREDFTDTAPKPRKSRSKGGVKRQDFTGDDDGMGAVAGEMTRRRQKGGRPDNISNNLAKLFSEDTAPKSGMEKRDDELMARYMESTDDI